MMTIRFADPSHTLQIIPTGPGAFDLIDEDDPRWQADAEPFVPPPALVPASISDRQFAQGLAGAGLITEAEALTWVRTGDLPAAIEAYVESRPAGERFAARMVLSGATIFERAHPLTAAFGAAVGMDDTALDTFWRDCAAL
jgi:hypothetical protein